MHPSEYSFGLQDILVLSLGILLLVAFYGAHFRLLRRMPELYPLLTEAQRAHELRELRSRTLITTGAIVAFTVCYVAVAAIIARPFMRRIGVALYIGLVVLAIVMLLIVLVGVGIGLAYYLARERILRRGLIPSVQDTPRDEGSETTGEANRRDSDESG